MLPNVEVKRAKLHVAGTDSVQNTTMSNPWNLFLEVHIGNPIALLLHDVRPL